MEEINRNEVVEFLNALKDVYYTTPVDDLLNGLELQNIKENMSLKYHPAVYFIKNEYTKMIKIGATKNISKRFKEFKSGFATLGLEDNQLRLIGLMFCPAKYINKLHLIEEKIWHKYINQCYPHIKRIGEWFSVSEEKILDDLFYYNTDGLCFEYKNIVIQKSPRFTVREGEYVSSLFQKGNELIEPMLYALQCFETNTFHNIANLRFQELIFTLKTMSSVVSEDGINHTIIKNAFVERSKLIIDNFITSTT